MLDKILALLKKFNLVPAEKEAEIKAALEKENLEPPKADTPIDTSKITDPAIKQLIEALENHVKVLSQQNTDLLQTLAGEKKAREDAAKIQSDQAAAARKKQIDEMIDKGVKDGKITEAKKPWAQSLAEKDVKLLEDWLKDAPIDKHAAAPSKDDKVGGQDTEKGVPPAMSNPLGTAARKSIRDKVAEFSKASEN